MGCDQESTLSEHVQTDGKGQSKCPRNEDDALDAVRVLRLSGSHRRSRGFAERGLQLRALALRARQSSKTLQGQLREGSR